MAGRDPLEDAFNDVPGNPQPRAPERSGAAFVWTLLGGLVLVLLVWVV
jgi:hypothetical protein